MLHMRMRLPSTLFWRACVTESLVVIVGWCIVRISGSWWRESTQLSQMTGFLSRSMGAGSQPQVRTLEGYPKRALVFPFIAQGFFKGPLRPGVQPPGAAQQPKRMSAEQASAEGFVPGLP